VVFHRSDPLLKILAWLVPFTCKSRRFPVNPLAALTPKPVPAVLHAVEVVPAGSMSTCGLVVVLVPPVNQVPVNEVAGVEAAPFVL
jgi:hypothetical protein